MTPKAGVSSESSRTLTSDALSTGTCHEQLCRNCQPLALPTLLLGHQGRGHACEPGSLGMNYVAAREFRSENNQPKCTISNVVPADMEVTRFRNVRCEVSTCGFYQRSTSVSYPVWTVVGFLVLFPLDYYITDLY